MGIRPDMKNSESTVKKEFQPSAGWSLRLLGGLALNRLPDGRKVALPGKRERALLAYLALSRNGRQPRRKLAALLWGDATDETLLDNLRTCIWRLRKALGDSDHRLLASDGEDIVLDIAAFDIDVLLFRRLAAQSDRTALEAATQLCHGACLDGLELDSEEFESWRRMETSRHFDQAIDVLTRLMKLLMDCGQSERAIEAGARILRLDPLHEATARHMMRLYAGSGRRGAAIQLYRNLAEALRRDVGAQPEAETRLAIARIAPPDEPEMVDPAWDHDGAAKSGGNAETNSSITQSTPTSRLRVAGLACAVFVAVALGYAWWVSQNRSNADGGQPVGHAVPAATTAIAVLPFGNLSGDPAQQFFSDGMTEEISSVLAKVPGLKLVARTSVFQFRNNKDVRQVGSRLGALYVIEGTVRKEGNRLRITAQLIRTDTGLSVWSDTYDRELSDIFVIQEDIATSIAESLQLSLGLAPGENLVSSRNIDPASYEQYLRAKPLVRARFTGTEQAIQILEPLVARSPQYAPAWALLAQSYAMMPAFVSPYSTVPGKPQILQRRQRIETYWPKAEVAARRAIQLDPKLADGYYAFGILMHFQGHLAAADDLFAKALMLDPYNPDALGLRMDLLADVGQLRRASAIAEKLLALDPYVPTWKQDGAEIFWEAGQRDRAVQLLTPLMDRPSVPSTLAMIYSAEGRYSAAADVMEAALKVRGEMPQGQSPMWRTAVALLRIAPGKAVFEHGFPHLYRVDFVYLHVGAPVLALQHYEDEVRTGLRGGQGNSFSYLWHPSFTAARSTTPFKTLMKNAGIVDYWRQRGWPSFCHAVSTADFVCD